MNTMWIKFIVLVFTIYSCSDLYQGSSKIHYLTLSDQLTNEDKAALSWLKNNPKFKSNILNLVNIDVEKDVEVVWLHIPDSATYQKWLIQKQKMQGITRLYKTGTKFLLTNYAALLPYELGIEKNKPEIKTISLKDNWLFDKKGLHSWRGHPAFNGLFNGVFIWDAFEDHQLPVIGYFENNFPQNGKVVAVERSYITIHRTRRVMMEYENKNAKILSIGSFVFFNKRNRLQYKLEKFLENSLLYLAGEFDNEPKSYWQDFDYNPREFSVDTNPLDNTVNRNLTGLKKTELILDSANPKNNFFDLAGRRNLIMGKENGGIDELWVHPFRILRDYQVGILEKDSVAWLENMPLQIEIRPESVKRIYQTPKGELTEIIFPSLEKPGSVIHYESTAQKDIKIILKFRSDLRWMWPYDEYALGAVNYSYDNSLNALHVKDQSSDFYCLFGGDLESEKQFTGAFADINWKEDKFVPISTDLNQVYHSAIFHLNENNDYCLNYALIGTNQGKSKALNHYRTLLGDPEKEYNKLAGHYTHILNNYVTIESPDNEFNELWKWTLIGTDRFFAKTPGLGGALLAGFSTTASGWNGRHKISGRPGYAWYFGRDSEWSGFAIDDYGDFKLVKEQLKFLQKYQDLSGKIFHEISTSGVVHYDAADATPLYIILAAHYLRASGDMDFISDSWSNIKKAMDFLYSTDTDGDLLIENTNVGHGWVEGGKLWGANTTFYLAGLWAQSLKDAAYIAQHLGYKDFEEKYSKDYQKVNRILNTDFWNNKEQFYYYGKYSDNSYNPEKTVLPAVLMYFGLLDENKVLPVLKEYAGNSFSSNWGVRILSSESPLFNPRGYHYGSVWPLFTGWTALAEYEYGNSTRGFMHIQNNLYIKNHWSRGYVEEVMNGAKYKPSGVCPHQCWSETNIIHPSITGMIGWKPDALNNEVTLKPRFPLHWDQVTVNNLSIADTKVKLQMTRSKNETNFTLWLEKGKPLKILLMPEIPLGMKIEGIQINGQEKEFSNIIKRGLLNEPLEFNLSSTTQIIIKHRGGVGIIPLQLKPKPGDEAIGYRILSGNLIDNEYILDLEGPAGSTGKFRLNIFDQKVKSVQGAKIIKMQENGILDFNVNFNNIGNENTRTKVVFSF